MLKLTLDSELWTMLEFAEVVGFRNWSVNFTKLRLALLARLIRPDYFFI